MAISKAFLTQQIATTEAAIVAAEAAADGIVAGTIASYELDTGQTRQKVTKVNIGTLNAYIGSLYNRLSTLCARRDGAGVTVEPAF